jgi:hypothetical protein
LLAHFGHLASERRRILYARRRTQSEQVVERTPGPISRAIDRALNSWVGKAIVLGAWAWILISDPLDAAYLAGIPLGMVFIAVPLTLLLGRVISVVRR